MKQIKITDNLHSGLRTFCDKQNVPLKDYIEGVLKTSMLFPDGIEIPESFTAAKEAKARREEFERGYNVGFKDGIRAAILSIIESEDWVFEEMSSTLGIITIGSSNPKLNTSSAIGIGVEPCFLRMHFEHALKEARTGSLTLKITNSISEKT